MAFYSHPPIQLYAYAPMAIPNQAEFYAVYPSGGHPGMVDASAFYYDGNPKGLVGQSTGESNFLIIKNVRCKMQDVVYLGQISLRWVSLFFHSP